MENIDIAYRNFNELLKEISTYNDTIFTEQDTRVKIIDRILIEILHWDYKDLLTEPKAGKGFIDYKLSINNSSKLIIEAKRDGKIFDLNEKYSGRSYKLNGAVFNTQIVKDGIEQAILYCAFKSTELACLSNGKEWIIFRGNRSGDGTDVMEGYAFVFSSLKGVLENFKLFYELLSKEGVNNFMYRSYFQESEGQPLRTKEFSKQFQTADRLQAIARGAYANDFDKTMNAFFKQLAGDEDPDLLAKCFVHTKESDIADAKLGRISEELIGTVKKISTESSNELSDVIERVKSTNRNEFVILVGGKGSGKSTYIERFFRFVLKEELKKDCILIDINLGISEGDETNIINWLNYKLIETLESVVFNGAPTFEELQGMFFHEYKRLSEGSWKKIYEKDKNEFKIEFGKHIESRRENKPEEYIKRIIGDISNSRKKVPCLVFDNTDHFTIEFQEKVFQYAMSIYEKELCLIILPITDKTSWQLSKQGALQSFDDVEVLYLPVPSPKRIIERRIHILKEKLNLANEKEKGSYLTSKGIRLSIDNLKKFVYYLQQVFLRDNKTATWIGQLANLDIRRALQITRDLIASPHLKIEELLKIFIGNESFNIKPHKIKNSLIKGKYNFYPIGQHNFIQNIFSPNTTYVTSPLLQIRILQLLNDKKSNTVDENSYISINQILEYFFALNIDRHVTLSILGDMLQTGLVYSYDPTIKDIKSAKQLEISPAGKQHFYWGINDDVYLLNMLDVTPIRDEFKFEELSTLRESYFKKPEKYSNLLAQLFINYLLQEDNFYCKISEHEAFLGQKKIINTLTKRITKKQ